MKHTATNNFHRALVCTLLFFVTLVLQADERDVLGRKIQLPQKKETIYKLLRLISDKTDYLFVYDSRILDNDKEVKIAKGEYTLRDAIYTVTGNKNLKITIVGNHILLQLEDLEKSSNTANIISDTVPKTDYIAMYGTIYDKITSEPLAYSSVGVVNSSIGTITNKDGEFKLILPDSLLYSFVKLTHVGYQSQELEVSLLHGYKVSIALEPTIVPLQEVVVRPIEPKQELNIMLDRRMQNYPSLPMYLIAFYREGIDYKKKNIDVTEAILKIYKTGYQSSVSADQVKLIKMRRVKSRVKTDTIFTKMKSGVNSCLMLDIMKNSPDFFDVSEHSNFDFTHTDISVIDERRINVISFQQKEHVSEPLFKGELFIDAENRTLVEARFQINPKYVEHATDIYVEKRSRDLKLTLQQAYYTISYKLSDNGVHYINHIRGELNFKVKRKHRLFSEPLRVWFEMVTCMVDTSDVNAFPKSERLPTRNVLSDTRYSYDKDFWGLFNVILPEDDLKDLIINNLSQVLEE